MNAKPRHGKKKQSRLRRNAPLAKSPRERQSAALSAAPDLQLSFLPPRRSITKMQQRDRAVHDAWNTFLPASTPVIRAVNRATINYPHIEVCAWGRSPGRAGVLGNAYDYLVGVAWAGGSLDGVFARVRPAVTRWGRAQHVAETLEQVLRKELKHARGNILPAPSAQFLRGLVLLAELDATYRSPAEPPRWILELEERPISERLLLRSLTRHYPDEIADELRKLLDATRADLGPGKSLIYNPVFGGAPGLEHVAADGDVIVGDMLLELKTSQRPFTRYDLWQLLAYVALDRIHGRERIRRLGLYNPRRRSFWSEGVERVTQSMGGVTLAQLCAWFRETPAANGRTLSERLAVVPKRTSDELANDPELIQRLMRQLVEDVLRRGRVGLPRAADRAAGPRKKRASRGSGRRRRKVAARSR